MSGAEDGLQWNYRCLEAKRPLPLLRTHDCQLNRSSILPLIIGGLAVSPRLLTLAEAELASHKLISNSSRGASIGAASQDKSLPASYIAHVLALSRGSSSLHRLRVAIATQLHSVALWYTAPEHSFCCRSEDYGLYGWWSVRPSWSIQCI